MIRYYDLGDDVKKLDESSWALIVIGGNSTGKTYSSLKYCIDNDIRFVFIKRTNDDVRLICAGKHDADLSPFKPLNRDLGWNIKPEIMEKGIGRFYEESDGKESKTVGYIASLNAVGTVKGFDLSDVDVMIFDEFIPQPWERVMRREGEQTLVMYRTISRDRELRGRKPLLMVCLANATRLSNPLMNILEITDTVSNMKDCGMTEQDIRGIHIHLLDDMEDFKVAESETAIQKSMKGTTWGNMSLGNDFAYDKTSCVGKSTVKGRRCLYAFIHGRKTYYTYSRKNGKLYVCESKGKCDCVYDLSFEDVMFEFNFKHGSVLRENITSGGVLFESYSCYDLILNFKKYYKI